jgi:serine protease Do
MRLNKKTLLWSRWIFVVGVLGLVWAFKTGRLLWTGSSIRRSSYKVLSNAPTAEVHPEVLNLQASFAKVAELVKPAVVSISTVRIEQVPEMPQFFFGDPLEQFFDQFFGPEGNPYQRRRSTPRQFRKFKMEGVGSGVLMDPEGLVLTNEHVVRDADEIKVVLYEKENEKKEYRGRVIGKDARTDLAVVRIKAGHRLPFAALGDSDKIKVGDWAIAIGSPFGLAQTVTVGVISAERQSLAIENKEYRNLIQTDAAINRGNSGGPLLNIRGEVVGINTAIYAPTGVFAGVGFAVPINQAKAIIEQLVQKGRVVRGWLGVELAREITPAMVKAFGLPDDKGALVNNVLKDSPAEKAGLKRGDIVRSYDRRPVESSDKLQSLVAQAPPKKKVALEVFRAKKKVELDLVIGERPESADKGGTETTPPTRKEGKSLLKDWLGAHVVNLTPELAESFRQPPDAEGVIVTDIDSGTRAEEMGLAPGDVIRAVNQEATPDIDAFSKAVGKVDLGEGVVFDILRQGRPLYLSYTKP